LDPRVRKQVEEVLASKPKKTVRHRLGLVRVDRYKEGVVSAIELKV
jgi:hypothetical protein